MFVLLLQLFIYCFQKLFSFNFIKIVIFRLKKNKFVKSIVLLALLIVVVSCSGESPLQTLILPSDSAMNDANRFALVIETYVSLRDKPGEDGITIAHARRLDIFQVEGIEIIKEDGDQTLWVNLGKGWIQRSSVQLYSSKEKVLTAAKKLK